MRGVHAPVGRNEVRAQAGYLRKEHDKSEEVFSIVDVSLQRQGTAGQQVGEQAVGRTPREARPEQMRAGYEGRPVPVLGVCSRRKADQRAGEDAKGGPYAEELHTGGVRVSAAKLARLV